MDTDDLSTETYNGIIIEAEKFNHDLTLQFGVLYHVVKTKTSTWTKSQTLISELRLLEEEELFDVFFANLPDKKSLNLTLDRIIENISKIRKIPKEQRHYEF